MFITVSGLIHLPKLNLNAAAKFCLLKMNTMLYPFLMLVDWAQSDVDDFILF